MVRFFFEANGQAISIYHFPATETRFPKMGELKQFQYQG